MNSIFMQGKKGETPFNQQKGLWVGSKKRAANERSNSLRAQFLPKLPLVTDSAMFLSLK